MTASFCCLISCSLSLLATADWQPIWHGTNNTQFALFRSPLITVTEADLPLMLSIAAEQSPRKAPVDGTTQSKLLGAYKLFVNGLPVTMGPGHNVPSTVHALDTFDLSRALPPSLGRIVLAIECFYDLTTNSSKPPRLQAQLNSQSRGVLAETGPAWLVWDADGYFNPTGDNGANWYHMPNEYLDRRAYPVGWMLPDFVPSSDWQASVVQARCSFRTCALIIMVCHMSRLQPPFDLPLTAKAAPPPVFLSRRACSVTALPQPDTYTCAASVAEAQTVTFDCIKPGSVISAVSFAAYGTPSGLKPFSSQPSVTMLSRCREMRRQ